MRRVNALRTAAENRQRTIREDYDKRVHAHVARLAQATTLKEMAQLGEELEDMHRGVRGAVEASAELFQVEFAEIAVAAGVGDAMGIAMA